MMMVGLWGTMRAGGGELLSADEVASYLTNIYYLFSNLHRNEVIGDIDSSDSDNSVDIFNYNWVPYVPLARRLPVATSASASSTFATSTSAIFMSATSVSATSVSTTSASATSASTKSAPATSVSATSSTSVAWASSARVSIWRRQALGGFVWDTTGRTGIRDSTCATALTGILQLAEAHPQGYMGSIANTCRGTWFAANTDVLFQDNGPLRTFTPICSQMSMQHFSVALHQARFFTLNNITTF